MTQMEKVARYLVARNRITHRIAESEFFITRLAAVIRRLRSTHKHLLPNDTEIVTHERESFTGQKYAEYELRRVQKLRKVA